MNNPLLSPSLAQQEYLADQLRRRSMIRIWRILLLKDRGSQERLFF